LITLGGVADKGGRVRHDDITMISR
jgi:hypothetical protein